MTDVLIVDDSLTVRMDLAEAFEAAGFRAAPCASLAEARQHLSRAPVRVIVLDVLLPDGDGVTLLAELRRSAAHAGAVVLMLSSEADVADRIRGMDHGADDYVGKPYDASFVVAKARELAAMPRTAGVAPVLIIDDSPSYRDALRAAFEAAGYAVLAVPSGEEGLRLAAERRPSAIVVDGVLEGIDGAAVIRRVRLDAALRRTPCLLLTGSDDDGAELAALEAGADAFVRKDEDVELVLARLAAVLRGTGAAAAESPVSLESPRRILAVDDSSTFLEELAGVLRADGFEVIPARSGEEALDLLAVQSVDCVLLDLVMPGLGGKETCKRIKSAPVVREIPLILLTAVDDRATMLDGLGAGADDYIPKSSEFEVLRARLRAQLRRKQFEDENRHIREQLLRREHEAAEAKAARELAETRAALAEELERKNQELEAFSYSVSHDLRAPLRAIDGFARALAEDCEERLDDAGRGHLRRIRAAAKRMGELIDDLLQLSRVTRAEIRRQPVDLAAIGRAVLRDLEARDPRRVEAHFPDALAAEGDPGLLRAVLENLLGNAWKFTRGRDPTRIELGADERDGKTVFFVRDNGVGFDMAYAEKLFRPFQRLHAQSEFDGTGIGLATVHRIVTRHGGRVWAESAPDQGTTLYFTLK